MTVNDFFKRDIFAAETGVELLEAGNGTARARLKIEPRHLNGGGVCQGGVIFTLADFAFAVAVNSHARLTLSIQANIQFFKSEREGYLYAEAREVFNHGKLASCNVSVTNEAGELIAMFCSMGYHKDAQLPFEPIE